MEPPSASPRAGRGPWQELLLAVSLLTSWNPLTTAQVTVESVPPNAAEGKDALLRVLNLPGDTAGLTWFRGEIVAPVHQIVLYVVDTRVIVPGPAYSGREIIYPNGSLLFQNITLKDTGSYILQIINQKFETALVPGQLRVFHGPDTRTISPSDSYYHLGVNLSLSCHTASNPPAQYSWLINGRPQPSTQELIISNITANDSRFYTCLVYNSGTCLHKTTVKTITVSDERSTKGLPLGSIIGIALVVLIGVALVATLGYLLICTRTGRASGWCDLREFWCPASTPCHAPASSSISPDSLPSPTAEVPIYQQVSGNKFSSFCQIQDLSCT
ncbi:carcinoembryonic antigen-related cell adhesion molecule 24 isoform X2 [Canis lupus familiaris]|uniref:carcinoembryonic antigen-related cell adhesion molecule 24 isoform X2 n=1 Tax=Canis lupus familiaris TaxID=9615 RepID=UPI0015F1B0E6|nr:carcinoembryonic antigen-related cell adhesion molecule 24 isoform X2 [Canis lupus familiaris]